MTEDMRCEAFQKQLNAYLDGELDEIAGQRMLGHARECARCGELLKQGETLLKMLSDLDARVEMPEEAKLAWRAAIREEAEASPYGEPLCAGQPMSAPADARRRPRFGAWSRTLAAMAAALVLLVGGTMMSRWRGSPSLIEGALPTRTESSYTAYAPAAGSTADSRSNEKLFMEADGAISEDSLELADTGAETGTTADALTQKAIVLKSASRRLETTAFDVDIANIRDLVSEYDGYFEQQSVRGQPIENGLSSGRVAEMTIRVPAEQLGEFLQSLDAVGTLTYSLENAEDISGRYYDLEARLNTYKLQRDRLNELVKSAANVEDIITIEDKLYDLQAEIDSCEGQLRGWDSLASYATVDATMTEVAARDRVQPIGESLGERMKNGFYDSVNWLMAFLQDMAVALAAVAPKLVVAIPLIALVWIVVHALRKRHRK